MKNVKTECVESVWNMRVPEEGQEAGRATVAPRRLHRDLATLRHVRQARIRAS